MTNTPLSPTTLVNGLLERTNTLSQSTILPPIIKLLSSNLARFLKPETEVQGRILCQPIFKRATSFRIKYLLARAQFFM
jgi:hypothetical protein